MSQLYPEFFTDSEFNEQLINNNKAFNNYYSRLKLLATSRFKWLNLPNSCSERFLEETLFNYGRAIFINDDTLGYLNLMCTPSSQLNVYNESLKYQAYSTGYSKEYTIDNSVLIRNNYSMIPTSLFISIFAYKLYLIDITIDNNIKVNKSPIIIKCDEQEKLSISNFMKNYDGNIPYIFVTKSFNDKEIQVLNTGSEFIADKLNDTKNNIWSEALTFLGINNNNTNKKERLITDEVNANNEQIELSSEVMLLTRKEACEKINSMFGLNIDVIPRSFNLMERTDELNE